MRSNAAIDESGENNTRPMIKALRASINRETGTVVGDKKKRSSPRNKIDQ